MLRDLLLRKVIIIVNKYPSTKVKIIPITMCNFWLIMHVDKSIEPLEGIRGNDNDSSQQKRTSLTNSIHSTAIAIKKI